MTLLIELDGEKRARLEAIGEELGIPRPMRIPGVQNPIDYPIDISKPNIHDTKKEFSLEKDAVERLRDDLINTLKALLGADEDASEVKDMRTRLTAVLDATARKNAKPGPFEQSLDMLQSSAVQHGISMTTAMVLAELLQALNERIQELQSQESVYWRVRGKPPNHYARAIALRLAKKIAQSTGRKPTFGTARDGGHPSTQYGHALEEILKILGIETSFRHPAKWALEQADRGRSFTCSDA